MVSEIHVFYKFFSLYYYSCRLFFPLQYYLYLQIVIDQINIYASFHYKSINITFIFIINEPCAKHKNDDGDLNYGLSISFSYVLLFIMCKT